MLWLKAFHIIAVICWFAGIFYLPRLFVYHAMAEEQAIYGDIWASHDFVKPKLLSQPNLDAN